MPTPIVRIDKANVQGIVGDVYTHPVSRFLLFRFESGSGARAFLGRIPTVTSTEEWQANHPSRLVNVALSFNGMKAGGALNGESLDRFPLDFRTGPTLERLKDDTPGIQWWNGVPVAELHCLICLHAADGDILEDLTDEVLDAATATGTHHQIVRAENQTIDGAFLTPPRRVHFDYLDGFSGPSFSWSDPAQPPEMDFRHFLLGYATADIESNPRLLGRSGDRAAVEFARDGSYVAFRVMQQDVAEFNRFLSDNARRLAPTLGMSEENAVKWLAAKMLGRWPSGQPLVTDPDGPTTGTRPEDDFNYSEDTQGQRCPFSSHIRVTNPRDQPIDDAVAPVPRVLRRGMPYGPPFVEGDQDAGKERGLIGMFLCSSLSGQFEKLMDWINRNDFSNTDVFPDLRAQDPLLGNRDVPLASKEFRIPTANGLLKATGLTTFVRARGTAYFLFPGLNALSQFTQGT